MKKNVKAIREPESSLLPGHMEAVKENERLRTRLELLFSQQTDDEDRGAESEMLLSRARTAEQTAIRKCATADTDTDRADGGEDLVEARADIDRYLARLDALRSVIEQRVQDIAQVQNELLESEQRLEDARKAHWKQRWAAEEQEREQKLIEDYIALVNLRCLAGAAHVAFGDDGSGFVRWVWKMPQHRQALYAARSQMIRDLQELEVHVS